MPGPRPGDSAGQRLELMGRKPISPGRGLVPISTLNGGESGGQAGERIMGILNPQEMLGPGGRVRRHQTAKSCLHLLVNALCLPIGLGVKPRRETGCGAHQATKLPPEDQGKLKTLVGNHIDREAMQMEDVL